MSDGREHAAREYGAREMTRDHLVPRRLAVLAAWAWRLIVLGAAVYAIAWVVAWLSLVAIPVIVALLLTALLKPLQALFRRMGMPRLAATWLAVLIGAGVVFGLGYVAAALFAGRWEELAEEARRTGDRIRDFLAQAPFGLAEVDFDELVQNVVAWLQEHQETITAAIARGTLVTLQVLAGMLLAFFVAFFLVHDGERIWERTVRMFPADARLRVDKAGQTAWEVLSGFIRGAAVIATIHALIIGVTLVILGVPLAGPLAILVFVGSFIPFAGAILSGALAVIVALATTGLVPALVVLAVLLGQNQLENIVLEPIVMKRYVQLHPLTIGLAVTIGAIVWGIPGALISVPFTAMVVRAMPHLTAELPEPGLEPDRTLPGGCER
jgi:predicted PurR-regulated permease PerM